MTYPYIRQGGSNSGSSMHNYIGNYSNLPQGITNAGSGGGNAYTRQVQDNELTSNQLNGLLASNNPYITQARQSGYNRAGDRGMLNGSISAGASQAAAIQAGLPIAQADAGTYSTAAGQNLDALNSILANNNNNSASMFNASTSAGASMYGADRQYQSSQNNLRYQGDQAGLNRGFQDYMAQQGYRNGMQRDAFQLGGNILQANNNFSNNLYSQALSNPFMMQNPDALQGYVDRAGGNASNYYDNLFGYALNGGQQPNGWQENSQWYNSNGGN